MGQLELAGGPLAWLWLFIITSVAAAPRLIQGLWRRGSGRREPSFIVQRAPQLATGIVFSLIMVSFEAIESALGTGEPSFGKQFFERHQAFLPIITLATVIPKSVGATISWFGVVWTSVGSVLLVSGLYTLRESFSTDAEILPGQALHRDGPYRFVLHPIYAGWVHLLLGSAITALAPVSAALVVLLVAPLFLIRAKHEEDLLLKEFGATFEEFAASRHGRRLIPLLRPAAQ